MDRECLEMPRVEVACQTQRPSSQHRQQRGGPSAPTQCPTALTFAEPCRQTQKREAYALPFRGSLQHCHRRQGPLLLALLISRLWGQLRSCTCVPADAPIKQDAYSQSVSILVKQRATIKHRSIKVEWDEATIKTHTVCQVMSAR